MRDAESIAKVLKSGLTVAELIDTLQGMDPTAYVVLQASYGDHHNTQQLLPVTEVNMLDDVGDIQETAYSASGICLCDHEDTEDEHPLPVEVVVLDSNC